MILNYYLLKYAQLCYTFIKCEDLPACIWMRLWHVVSNHRYDFRFYLACFFDIHIIITSMFLQLILHVKHTVYDTVINTFI